VATFIDGVATFGGLLINEAGSGFTLKFTTNRNLGGSKTLSTNPFNVNIGPVALLTFDRTMSQGVVKAGEFFSSPPQLTFRDAGGNHIKSDSQNALQVQCII
jgi:hypothetical protein